MRIRLKPEEAQIAAHALLAMQSVRQRFEQEFGVLSQRLAEVERKIREREDHVPDTPVQRWNWAYLDMLHCHGEVEIPEPEIPPQDS